MSDYSVALAVAVEAARQAGALLREEFHRPGGPRGERGSAPADVEAERLIQQKLLAALRWDYLGEELGFVDNQARPHLWLVDPNDGTRSYLKGRRGSAVSIAALRAGVPVLGVVYAFAYPDDEGDLIAWAEGCGPITRNGRPVEGSLTGVQLDRNAVVFVSQGADENSAANLECVRPGRYVALPSIAYRLARVAAGDGVAAVSLNRPAAWDYAAGHALLRAAGGVMGSQDGEEAAYAPDGRSYQVWCFGGAADVVQELRQRDWHNVFYDVPQPEPPYCLARPVSGRTVTDSAVLARAQGCLLGQLAGDALGGLVEFRSGASIRATYPDGCRELLDGGTWHNLAGQPTDDSELALMLARTLAHRGRYDPAEALEAYVYWYDSDPFDIGGTINQALGAAADAPTPPERLEAVAVRASQSSQANGSLMRVSPLGIFGAGRARQAALWARQDSKLTHPHPVCQDCCAVFVTALATAIQQGCGPQECYAAALTAASDGPLEPAVREVLEKARHEPPASYEHNMGWVLIALQNAFYRLLHAPGFEEGVIATVMAGGDTDTNGAVAGALLGAVHGRKAIPPRWIRALLSCRPMEDTPTAHPRPVEFWPVDALELAEALLWVGTIGEPGVSTPGGREVTLSGG